MGGVGYKPHERWDCVAELYQSESQRGSQQLPRDVATEPTPHHSIKFAPTDVISYSAFNLLDLPKLWQMVMGFVESMPPEMSREVLGSLQQMETMMGIDIEDDLLSWMGNEIALLQTGFTMLSPGMEAGAMSQLLLSIQTSDSAKAAEGLGQFSSGRTHPKPRVHG